MKPKLHIHSDSSFFGGAENMVGLILTDPKMQNEFQISFSYRKTAAYETGLAKWVGNITNSFPLTLPTSTIEAICSRIGVLSTIFRFAAEPFVFVAEFITVTKLLRKLRPDILHLNNGGYPGALSTRLAPIAAKVAGVKICVMVVNNLAVPYNRPARMLEWPIDVLSRRFVSIYLTASESASDRLRNVLDLPISRTRVIANGIAKPKVSAELPVPVVESIAKTEGTVKLGIAAIFEPRKGHAVLFDALRHIAERIDKNKSGVSYSLLVQASQADFKIVNELLVQKGVSSRTTVLDIAAVDLINAIDIFVLPSTKDEDFPNVNLIAMSLEKPIISTNLAGIPTQVKDHFNGLIVEPGDAVALAKAIETLGCDSNLAKTLGANGLSRFEEKYTAQTALGNYKKLYRSLLAESYK